MLDPTMEELKLDIVRLKYELCQKEQQLQKLLLTQDTSNIYNDNLSTEEIVRYSRQMIMPDINLCGQIALKNSKVLIVGAGGLGCPSSLYLASAGVGQITLIDYDEVELSNLHRQILHFESDINVPKVESAFTTLKSLNSNISVIPIRLHASSSTLKDVMRENKYDVVVDGSDNVATRYLLNDACVLNDIPLVSGSALQMEGQLTVYHYEGGPCYRCLFPVPPPAHAVTNCGDGGVLGAIPGTIGVLQALETIKIITKSSGVLSGRLLLFDGSNTTFRNVKLRQRNLKCDVCGENPTITDLIDYEQFCGSSAHDKVININILKEKEQVDVRELPNILKDSVVFDVRPELEYKMCHLPNTINLPYSKIEKGKEIDIDLKQLLKEKHLTENISVYVLCRRGNDSQRAISCLKDKISDIPITFYNIRGGLHAYSKFVDSSFPVY